MNRHIAGGTHPLRTQAHRARTGGMASKVGGIGAPLPSAGWLAGLKVEADGRVTPLDAVLTHPISGAKLYIGSHQAVENKDLLATCGISCVVCCAAE